jgi:hypothetical protein
MINNLCLYNVTDFFLNDSAQNQNYIVVWFQNEDKYSIVETKNVIEKDPKEKEMVTVKEAGSAQWVGCALFNGEYEHKHI